MVIAPASNESSPYTTPIWVMKAPTPTLVPKVSTALLEEPAITLVTPVSVNELLATFVAAVSNATV